MSKVATFTAWQDYLVAMAPLVMLLTWLALR